MSLWRIISYKNISPSCTNTQIVSKSSRIFTVNKNYATENETSEHRNRLDQVAKEFNFTQMSDWYKLSPNVTFLSIFHSNLRTSKTKSTMRSYLSTTIPSTIF